jgi:hypothetical protein
MTRTSLALVATLAAATACSDSVSQPGVDAAASVDAMVLAPDAAPTPDAAPGFTAHRIDFDELARGATVTDQYAPEAVFAAAAGQSVVVKADFDLGTSVPNYVCGSLNCDAQFSISFGAPVRGLALTAGGSDSSGVVATIVVHEMNGARHERQVFGSNVFTQPIPVDLSATLDIVKIEILNGNDGGGVAWDDIAFEYPEGTPPID